MKRIIVTTDLSEQATAAFPIAKQLASLTAAEIQLLVVVEDPARAALMYAMDFPIMPGREVLEQLKEKVQNDLQALSNKHFSSVNSTSVVIESEGGIHTSIMKYAQKQNADLLVMATHGRTGIRRMLIGSVAEKVIRECSLPVLTVPCMNECSGGSDNEELGNK